MENLKGVSLSSAMCEKDQIAEFDKTAAAFMQTMFNLDASMYMLSDESELDELSYVAVPQSFIDATTPLELRPLSWDDWMLTRIRDIYGVELTTTRIYLVDLFNRIEQARNRQVH